MNLFFASGFGILLLSSFNPTSSCPSGGNDNHLETRQVQGIKTPLPIEGMGLTELEFGYKEKDGPQTWPSKFHWCGKDKQSPININLESSNVYEDDSITFTNYNLPPQNISLVNNGKTINLGGTWSIEDRPFISSSLLEDDYIFEALHFHWGNNDNEGSEHLINGKRYPLEMHLVHFKKSYRSFPRSVNYIDGLAVLSYVFEVHHQNNHHLQNIIDVVDSIHNAKARAVLTPFPLHNLAHVFSNNFASYKGSLTTPPCNEIVTWFVHLKPQKIGVQQLNKLRELKDDDGDLLVKNFRPIQPLKDREITYVPKY